MASQDFLQMRALAGEETLVQKLNDEMVVLRIRDIANGTSTPTVVLSDTQSDITITDSDGNATTCDLSNASYNTVGEVADYLNAAAGFEVRVLDALRSDASNDKWLGTTITAATTSEGESTFDILQDSSGLAAYRLRVSLDRKADPRSSDSKGSHRVVLKKLQYYADLTAGTGGVNIVKTSGALQSTESQIFSAVSVDTTDTEHDLSDGITAGEGNEFVICIDTTVVNSASGYVQAQFIKQ